MKIFNTLSRQIETVTSINNDQTLGLYACGVTVYDYTHLGHIRKYTFDDVLVRALRSQGFKVKFVQNVTDVGHLTSDADSGEDKLEKGARARGQTAWEVAQEFEAYFWQTMDAMNNIRPDISCRATDHIPQQLNMVLELEKKGFTYVIPEDGVYFDTSKLSDYGQLARLNLPEQKAGARVEVVAGKKQASDFALWKFERPGENRAMVWESPWSKRSFPGWHIECSAMSTYYLGDQFEIHTGGIDHIPVHHPNEIAQTEAATGKKPFVKYWVHHNFMQVDGQKMSKSLGNYLRLEDILAKNYQPMSLRLLLLMGHYRAEMNFTWEALDGAQAAWQKLQTLTRQLWTEHHQENVGQAQPSSLVSKYLEQFNAALNQDLNTSQALAVMWEMLKNPDLTASQQYQLLLKFDEVFGLGLAKLRPISQIVTEIAPEIQQLWDQRQMARQSQDWQIADQLRQQLLAQGWEVKDQPNGESELFPRIKES